MAFQPRSYPLVDSPRMADPLQSLTGLMYAARQFQAYGDEARERKDQQAVERALNEAGGDYGMAAQVLGDRGQWRLAKPMEEKAQAVTLEKRRQKEQEFGQMIQRADALPSAFGKAGQLLDQITTPEQYTKAVPVLREWATTIHPDLAAKIPDTYDANQVAEWRASLPVMQQKATRVADGLKQFLPGADPVKGLALLYETADTDEEREQITARAKYFELPDAIISAGQKAHREAQTAKRQALTEMFAGAPDADAWGQAAKEALAQGFSPQDVEAMGPWSPAAAKRALRATMTPAQRATEDRAAVDDKRQQESADAMASIARQREARLEKQDRAVVSQAQRATAERWKTEQLEGLEREVSRADTDGVPLSTATIRRRQLQIENSYRTQIGAPQLSALPKEWLGDGDADAEPEAEPDAASSTRRPIPGVPGGEAELRNGRWIRVK